jgi:hypothetical protein
VVPDSVNAISSHNRSRVTNSRPFITGDARTAIGRRIRDLVIEFSHPFGGFKAIIDEPLKQTIRRAAVLATQAEFMDAKIASGEAVDPVGYSTICNSLARALRTIEAKRPTTPKSTPSVQETLALINGEGETP